MATTYKLFLDQRYKKKDNTYPLKIRITINRKTKEIPVDIFIEKKYWDDKSQKLKHSLPNYQLIQLKVSKKISDLQERILLTENLGNETSIESIAETIKPRQSASNFLSFAREQIKLLIEENRIGNSIAYQCAVTKLENYITKKDLKFEDIDYSFLENFNAYMVGQGMRTNAISCYLRTIRAIYNKAMKQDVVETRFYPFLKYKIKSEKTINRALTLNELKSIVDIDIAGIGNMTFHRQLFLLSFCLIGINFADLLTLTEENLINNRIVFHRKKTKKVYSIKVLPKIMELITSLQQTQSPTGYLLPFIDKTKTPLQQKKDIGLVIHANNDNMKKIAEMAGVKKPISTYYARYSWANIAKSVGYSKDLIAEALGHEYGNKVTGIYLEHFDKELIDEMNNNIVNKLFS
ncbi:MAG: site-specific integrase [Niabella sp.]